MNASKAWLAAVIAGLSSFIATVQGRTDVDSMRVLDWVIVVLSAVIAALVVYVAPYKPAGS